MPADVIQEHRSRVASVAVVQSERGRGFVAVHPRYRAWLAKCGLVQPEAFLELRGEIVSGHSDRHVMRVELPSGTHPRIAYLKREHRVGWRVRRRNRLAGFGPVSRCVREAKVLEHLDSQALPGPHWIAYGEDACGRAFLLVDDLTGMIDLRVILKCERDPAIRRELAAQLGTEIAALHAARIDTPDLAAKHIFVRPDTGSAAVIDWPSATIGTDVTQDSRLTALAQLDASLADILATPRERLRCLRVYLKQCPELPSLTESAKQIAMLSRSLQRRSSIRDQRCDPAIAARQRLIWLAETEVVCVTPSLADSWPTPPECSPYYPEALEECRDGVRRIIDAPDGRPATLIRWRTFAPLGRIVAALRSHAWRSPATKLAKQIFRDERLGQPSPRLLAFGQRFTDPFTAESFVLLRTGEETPC